MDTQGRLRLGSVPSRVQVGEMNLSRDFTFAELASTSTGLPNNPGPGEAEKLLYLANYVLQPVRDRWGRVIVTSGFRAAAVNRRVGGSPASQHTRGEAADIVPADDDIKRVFHWLAAESGVPFGQAILELAGGKRWIHASLVRPWKANGEALVFDGGEYRAYRGEYEYL